MSTAYSTIPVMIVFRLRSKQTRIRLERMISGHGFKMHAGCWDLDISLSDYRKLLKSLHTIEWTPGDHVRVVPLCERCSRRVKYLGGVPERAAMGWIIIDGELREIR